MSKFAAYRALKIAKQIQRAQSEPVRAELVDLSLPVKPYNTSTDIPSEHIGKADGKLWFNNDGSLEELATVDPT